MSRWALSTCYIWPWTIYRRLSRTSLVNLYRSRVVPEVSHISGITFFHISEFCRCVARPGNLDAPDARRRTQSTTDFIVRTLDRDILWNDFGLRADVLVCHNFLISYRSFDADFLALYA